MYSPNFLQSAIFAITIFLWGALGADSWSFTMWESSNCTGATTFTDKVKGSGNSSCLSVPNGPFHKSLLSDIEVGNKCKVDFYTKPGCGDRVMYSLTESTTACVTFEDFWQPLVHYRVYCA